MLGGEYEDGEETKSDFLARMLLMDRIEIDPTGKYDFKLDLVQLCETQKTSLNNRLFKNIPHVGSFCTLLCICAFDTWEYNF